MDQLLQPLVELNTDVQHKDIAIKGRKVIQGFENCYFWFKMSLGAGRSCGFIIVCRPQATRLIWAVQTRKVPG